MNIVMVGPFGLYPKHTMRYRALPMARALVRRGHHVTILLPPWSNPKDAGTEQHDGGVRVVNLRLPPRIPLYFHGALTVSLARATLALAPQVVHVFKPKAYAGLTLWLLRHLRLAGFGRSRLVLDSDDWEGRGGWNDRDPHTPLHRWFFAEQERWCLGHADAVTVASRTLQSLAWSAGARRDAVYYVPNGVDPTSAPEPPPPQAPSGSLPPTVLLYTRFVEFTPERVAALLRKMGERCPDARLTVAGIGLAGEEERLKAGLRGSEIERRTEWLGWVEAKDLQRVFAASTLTIYPMDDTLLNRAKCPVKITDLLREGVVVVAEAVGQLREYIEPGVSGLLVAPGDEEEFLASIARALDDSALRRRLSLGARAHMRDQFGWDRLVAEVERAYAA